ncbi:MAG: carboxylesterase family protein, partial [Caldicoprobacteraceae bacterium]
MLRRVVVENGVLEGLPAADPRITVFKGVPFAAPPVGDLRWRPPQPCPDWEGVYKAYTFAPISMQATPGLDPDNLYTKEWHVDPNVPMSEDCLYLNVWTPAKHPDEKLPVMVWIFGGGLQVGYTSEMEFDGERIARRGVILV